MTRNEHLVWCKTRALQYLDDNDINQALTSMMSDLMKHPETKDHVGIQLGVGLSITGALGTIEEMRKFIEGFN